MLERIRRGRREDPARVRDAIRATIVALDDQRRSVAAAAAQAFVSQAEVGRLCNEQLLALSRAFQQADDATVTAERAARRARVDHDPEADAYVRTAAALRASQGVLAAAAEPIHALLAGAAESAGRARAVITESRVVLDTQLREQIRALQVFEKAQNARALGASRPAADS